MVKLQFSVICIGAGGTGGNFLKEFGRYMSFYSKEDINIKLAIVDGDKVERKNFQRQPFIDGDENCFKADVLASALIENFNLSENDVYAFNQYISTADDIEDVRLTLHPDYRNKEVVILIGAVDNHRARQEMHKFFKSKNVPNIIYIDSANEFHVGEVITAIKISGKVLAPPRAYYYPDILKDKSRPAGELSCGVINISAPQHITTNIMAGNICLIQCINCIEGTVKGGITYFDSEKMFSRFDEFKNEKE